jgi:RimJ/RimL family protein N-acetyltransferase
MILKCLSIEKPDPAFLALDGKYRAGFLDPATIWRYAREPEYDLNEPSVHRALAAKDECFAIVDGDRLAAYGWYSRAGTAHLSDTLRLHFDRDWAYMYRGFTHPAYRGQRLHAIGMTMALASYLQRGTRGFVSMVESRNEASLKSCARMGYTEFGTLYEFRIARLLGVRKPQSAWMQRHIIFRTPGCQAFGFWLEALTPRGTASTELAAAAFSRLPRVR